MRWLKQQRCISQHTHSAWRQDHVTAFCQWKSGQGLLTRPGQPKSFSQRCRGSLFLHLQHAEKKSILEDTEPNLLKGTQVLRTKISLTQWPRHWGCVMDEKQNFVSFTPEILSFLVFFSLQLCFCSGSSRIMFWDMDWCVKAVYLKVTQKTWVAGRRLWQGKVWKPMDVQPLPVSTVGSPSLSWETLGDNLEGTAQHPNWEMGDSGV